MARLTGLEPATSGVTGRHSNQLSYNRAFSSDTEVSAPYPGQIPNPGTGKQRGAVDGARTRDPRRDRPVL
jgi:hypothetical protein